MTREYRDQIAPVIARDKHCFVDNFSAGRFKSPRPPMTRPHFKAGAQKNTVLGPAGWFHRGRKVSGTNLSATETIPLYNRDIVLLELVEGKWDRNRVVRVNKLL